MNPHTNLAQQKILLTGGSGMLGAALQSLDASLIAPPSTECDITQFEQLFAYMSEVRPDVVLHVAAATHPPQHEENPTPGLSVNIIGTANVALACYRLGCRMVYISTDYVYTGGGPHKENEPVLPPSKYAWSKLGGECAARLLNNALILRLSFGPRPFPWDKVYADQYNSKLYVDEVAPLILRATRSSATGVMNVGGMRGTLVEYAKRTKADIETIPRPNWVPRDTSLNTDLFSQLP
ncbi:MAG: sugar nucleotide-binding protein [Patescibacteria group bacterium]